MNWHFNITAAPTPRLLMRVALIFDQQRLTLSALDWRSDQQTSLTNIRLCVDCDEALARRIHAKLFHLQDIMDVLLASDTGTPLVERLAAFAPDGADETF